ncbi:MAG TPA: DoxX family protein [Blastocatellia bacterium]|nr:DoxX family protein [Blastocatellia bacterium]
MAAGTIMFAHGIGKLSEPALFAASALGGIPLFLAYMVIAAEFVGGLMLLAGFLVRLAAFGHLCVLTVALIQVHWAAGLIQPGGFEFPLSLIAASIALLLIGGDPLSIDSNAGLSVLTNRTPFRRENIDVTSPGVKITGVVLILAGIALPFVRRYIGISEGVFPLAITILVAVASATSGAATIFGSPRAYVSTFVMARLYLAGSTLMLFWFKYTVRGLVAVVLSLGLLAALRTAQRGMK